MWLGEASCRRETWTPAHHPQSPPGLPFEISRLTAKRSSDRKEEVKLQDIVFLEDSNSRCFLFEPRKLKYRCLMTLNY